MKWSSLDNLRPYLGICLESLRKPMKTSIKIVPAEIRTGHFPITSQKPLRSNQLRARNVASKLCVQYLELCLTLKTKEKR
jgi:hypothetical protein